MIMLMLLSIGLVMVYSTSTVVSEMDPTMGTPYFFVKKQLIWLLLSSIAFITCLDIPYRWIAKNSYIVFGIALFLIFIVLIPKIGVQYNGARRWLRVAGMGVQPSDFMKLAMILMIARYLEDRNIRIRHFLLGFVPVFTALSFSCFLILLEPDFGTSCFIMLIGMIMLLVAGMNWQHLVPMLVVSLPMLIYLAIFKLHHIYARIHIYLDPTLDPLNKGYQIRQSLIALGTGGITGTGLGWSQQKLFFLSEESTDFIFAIIGEELGFLGTFPIIILYIFLAYYGIHVVRNAPDIFAKMASLGIVLWITIQAAFNIAVVTHTIPAKGISLPFISFGGSGLFFSMIAMGILVNIAGQCETEKYTFVKK